MGCSQGLLPSVLPTEDPKIPLEKRGYFWISVKTALNWQRGWKNREMGMCSSISSKCSSRLWGECRRSHAGLMLGAGLGSAGCQPLPGGFAEARRRRGRLGAAAGAFQEKLFHLQGAWRGLEGAASFPQGNGANTTNSQLPQTLWDGDGRKGWGRPKRFAGDQQTRVPLEAARLPRAAAACVLPSSPQPGWLSAY